MLACCLRLLSLRAFPRPTFSWRAVRRRVVWLSLPTTLRRRPTTPRRTSIREYYAFEAQRLDAPITGIARMQHNIYPIHETGLISLTDMRDIRMQSRCRLISSTVSVLITTMSIDKIMGFLFHSRKCLVLP